jgi:transposase
MDISEQSVRAHYGELLGVGQQWEVERVELDHVARRIETWAVWCKDEALMCPQCRETCPGYDHLPLRTWRHLDACGFTTLLHARIPRCRCERHGIISVRASWAEPGSRFTLAFEQHAVEVLLAASSLSDAAQLLRLDWDAAHRIQRRAVERGMARRAGESTPYLGIDEKSFGRGQSYGSVLSDLTGRRVLEVVQNRDEQAARSVLEELPLVQRQSVEAVAMDMWKPFINAVSRVLPEADIVFDKFHIVRLLHEGVDRVRRQEHRHLQGQGEDTLSGSKYLWLKSPVKHTPKQWASFKELLSLNLKVGRAWVLKQTFEGFWECEDESSARVFFKQWFGRAKRSKLPAIKSAADTIKAHLRGILTYFTHRITNASAEGLNSLIQSLKSAARGFRNFANYRTAILFHLGKLSLKPITTHTFA